jgi:NitT/TauT family transport system ATP-binding protein
MNAVARPGTLPAAQSETRAGPASLGGSPGSLVSVAGVSRRFHGDTGEITALDNISFEVRHGEFLAIVGPSGCGKTTLLRMLAGLDRPTDGTIAMAKPDVSNAMIFQGRSVFPWMTVRRNIGYGLEMRGAPKAERKQRVEALLRAVGIEGFGNAYPHTLSEGMRQRVAIARALAVDPDLLLMDEPFSALDEQTKLTLQEEVLALWERTRKTVVFITHSIDEALVLGDRVMVMSARPGTIREVIPVPFARPRGYLTVRTDPTFGELFGRIWELLRSGEGPA